jgi:rRNA processing protein Gar1
VSCGAGLLQRDLWPFSNWPLVAGIQPLTAQHARLLAVDRHGREYDVDYRAWEPFPSDELIAWANRRLLELDRKDRDRAADFLVDLVERARISAREGRRVGYVDRAWGRLAAPYFLLHPEWWRSPSTTPPEPLVGVRLYHETWNLDERRANPSAVRRSLVYGYSRP